MWSWLAVGLSSLLFIYAVEKGDTKRTITFSVMTHGLLLAILLGSEGISDYQLWLSLGLALFLISDVGLLLDRFGRASFVGYVIAQLVYSIGLWGEVQSHFVLWLPALLLCVAIVTFFLLLPRLDSFLLPVAIMGLSLVNVVCAAGEAWLNHSDWSSLQAFIGTLCLSVSAMMWALGKYHFKNIRARYGISGSYYLSHALIVASAIAPSL
ncbi:MULTISPECIES: lysoplasmalogenase [Vibrio]|uniref:lysoplasmalogenase n=1 Tax=Vibrio TaxID=662 RepID=UPI003D0B0416